MSRLIPMPLAFVIGMVFLFLFLLLVSVLLFFYCRFVGQLKNAFFCLYFWNYSTFTMAYARIDNLLILKLFVILCRLCFCYCFVILCRHGFCYCCYWCFVHRVEKGFIVTASGNHWDWHWRLPRLVPTSCCLSVMALFEDFEYMDTWMEGVL